MIVRPTQGPDGHWRVEIGKGPASFHRDGFANLDDAQSWAADVIAAAKPSTIRVGHKRIAATGAEALRRWAIDQGTLPSSEGGTHRPPIDSLATLLADPANALPLFALTPADLAAQRARRSEALGDDDILMVEQAALSLAIDDLSALYLPALQNPFSRPAPDGIFLPDDAQCASLLAEAGRQDADLHCAVALILTVGVSPTLLVGGRLRQRDGRLLWDGGSATWPEGLALPPGRTAPLPPGWTLQRLTRDLARIGGSVTTIRNLWLKGLALAMRDGRHLDEAFALLGHPQREAA